MSNLRTRGGRLQIPRSRGATSGFLLLLLGVWGALIPFVGPYFDFSWTPDTAWTWTTARGWLEVLPGAATAFGGLLLLASRNRVTTMFGAWLAIVAGAWFIVGRAFATTFGLGDIGMPVATTQTNAAIYELFYFTGLGALIVFLGSVALGRLSVRSQRDIQFAQDPYAVAADRRPMPATQPAAETASDAEATPPGEQPHKRVWGGMFGRRHGPAH